MELIEAIYRGDKPGIGGEPLILTFPQEIFQHWKKGDHITYDHRSGTYLHVEAVFISYLGPHAFAVCRVMSSDMKTTYIEVRHLVKGIDYIKVGEDLGDFGKM